MRVGRKILRLIELEMFSPEFEMNVWIWIYVILGFLSVCDCQHISTPCIKGREKKEKEEEGENVILKAKLIQVILHDRKNLWHF